MEKLFLFLNKHGQKLTLLIVLVIFIRSCTLNSNVSTLKSENIDLVKQINALSLKTDSLPDKSIINNIVEDNLYQFLIFEDDLDKGKTSLSEIKLRLEQKK